MCRIHLYWQGVGYFPGPQSVRPGRLWNRFQDRLPEVAQTHSDTANLVDQGNSLHQVSEFRAFARTLACFDLDAELAVFFVAPTNGRNDISIGRLPVFVAVDSGLVDHHLRRRKEI